MAGGCTVCRPWGNKAESKVGHSGWILRERGQVGRPVVGGVTGLGVAMTGLVCCGNGRRPYGWRGVRPVGAGQRIPHPRGAEGAGAHHIWFQM
jgi:hypothetical protein